MRPDGIRSTSLAALAAIAIGACAGCGAAAPRPPEPTWVEVHTADEPRAVFRRGPDGNYQALCVAPCALPVAAGAMRLGVVDDRGTARYADAVIPAAPSRLDLEAADGRRLRRGFGFALIGVGAAIGAGSLAWSTSSVCGDSEGKFG